MHSLRRSRYRYSRRQSCIRPGSSSTFEGGTRNFGSERFAQLYPGVDYSRWVGRFVTGYRAANIVIAVLGLLLLGWLFTRIQQPDWAGEVIKPGS